MSKPYQIADRFLSNTAINLARSDWEKAVGALLDRMLTRIDRLENKEVLV